MSDQLIGAFITLIATNDVRYDGVLFSVNTAESKIVLRDVHILGTEDRVTDPAKKVAASSPVLPFVTFPGTEIKDLWVHSAGENKAEPQAAAAPAANVPTPPTAAATPVTAAAAPQQPKKQQQPRQQAQPQENKQVTPAAAAPTPVTAASSTPASTTAAEANGDAKHQHRRRERALPGTGSHLMNLRTRGGKGDVDLEGGEFDFVAGLSQFDKDAEASTFKEQAPAAGTSYRKDDFFDAISSDVMDGGAGSRRIERDEERRLNQETFGATALQSGFRGRGRGRGRGGRGRGRGNYQHSQNSQHYHQNQTGGDNYQHGGEGRGRGRGRRGGRGRGRSSGAATAPAATSS